MKKKSPPYAIIGAVILGLVAIYAFVQWKAAEEKKTQDAVAAANASAAAALADAKSKQVSVTPTTTNLRNVLYATQPVEPGARISAAFFEKKLTPKDILPDAFSGDSDIVGWYAVRKIEKGDPLTPRNIGKSLPYMEQRISPGMRAISLKVFNAQDNMTGGFAVDGDRVDLLYTSLSEDNKYQYGTHILMQNLKILFVPGPAIKTEKTDGVTPVTAPSDSVAITFEVTPEQAEALEYVANVKSARIGMILRSRADDTQVKIKPFNSEDMSNLTKVQKITDKSYDRVKELAAEIEAKAKAEGTQGTPNETTPPTPPSP